MSNNCPLVSIITPCYNSEGYLNRYLENILRQTYSNIELIIVNDGSVDKTEEIALSYEEKFIQRGYKLVYVKQENKGLGGAINTALKYITGEYFTWCDSDNFYTEDYVEEKVNFFLRFPQYSVVRCDGYIVKETNLHKPIGLMSGANTDKFQEKLFEYCLLIKNFHFGCAMLRTADFDALNPEREIYPSRHGQNWQLLLPMLYHYTSGYIDKPMFYFVYRATSVSNCVRSQSVEKKYEQQEEYIKILLTTLDGMDIADKDKYVHAVKSKYHKKLLMIAANARDMERLEKEYLVLQELGVLDQESQKAYKVAHSGFLRAIQKVGSAFSRVWSRIKRAFRGKRI